jgi:DNA-binding IclR family transcriptional regulator
MALINVITTPEEHAIVLEALKKFTGKTAPVSAIAREADLGESRTRYVLMDLEEAGKIKRIPTKAFNKNYIRYRYEVTE